MTSPAPGWYPDPSDPSRQIYFDGQRWVNPVPEKADAEVPRKSAPAGSSELSGSEKYWAILERYQLPSLLGIVALGLLIAGLITRSSVLGALAVVFILATAALALVESGRADAPAPVSGATSPVSGPTALGSAARSGDSLGHAA